MDFNKIKNKPLITSFIFILVYLFVARLSLTLAFENSNASPIWPPSGLAVALIFLCGKRFYPAIFIAAFFANLITFLGQHSFGPNIFFSSALIGLGNTIEALIAFQFYHLATDNNKPLKNPVSFLIYISIGIAACFAGAFIGTLVLWQGGFMSSTHYNTVLITWWLGDFIGIITIGSMLIALKTENKYKKHNSLEYIITLISLAICSIVIFTHIDSQSFISQIHFILLPIFLWICLRFNFLKTIIAINLMAILAILGTAKGYGPFQEQSINHSLLLVQLFLGIIAITFSLFNLRVNHNHEEISEEPSKSSLKAQWFSLLTFALCMISSIIIINQKHKQNQFENSLLIRQKLTLVNEKLTQHTTNLVDSLKRLANRQALNKSQNSLLWDNDAQSYINHFFSLDKLEYFNAKSQLIHTAKHPDFSDEKLQRLHKVLKLRYGLIAQKDKTPILISPPSEKSQKSILAIVPGFVDDKARGYIVANCNFQKFINSILGHSQEDYSFAIRINDQLLMNSHREKKSPLFREEISDRASGLQWSISMQPTPKMRAQLQKNDRSIQIVLGLFISILMSITVFLSINSGSRANELKKMNENLNKKNTELIKQKIAARQAAQAKDSFLTNMSHEIRTPMNGVLGALQLANECSTEELPQYLRVIDVSAKSLMGVIDEILDYSNLESGEITIETASFNLAYFINNSVKIIESATTLKGINLQIHIAEDLPKYVMGDPVRLKQIMVNLLSNALKFTDRGTIEVIVTRDFNETLKIEVKDTGSGIPEHMIKTIFKHFEQMDQTSTRSAGGAGLGLAICRSLVSMMAGSLNVVSRVEHGSNFILKIPLIVGKRPKTLAHLDELTLITKRILVCEDDSSNCLILKKILEKLGLQIITAKDGQEALSILEREWQKIDMVFMDIEMPVYTGIEVMNKIRQQQPLFNVPVVALTANSREEDKEMCQAAGMKGFLTKPVNKDKLQSEIDRWLQAPK